jgi:uncharacterized protein
MIWLLDGNILTALCIQSHVHHEITLKWFYSQPRLFATCSVTEGTLLRIHMMVAPDPSPAAAWKTLTLLHQIAGHQFWDHGFSYLSVPHLNLSGHRQVTDSWLAELTRRHQGRLATLDAGLAQMHSDIADLIQ